MSLLDDLDRELRTLAARGLTRSLREVTGPQEASFILGGRQVANFSSNNYLGLANHPALREAAGRSLAADGMGAGASRLIAGNLRPHRELEARLARFHDRESALLFTSGYQANVGVLSALAGPEDAIFSDELNHASLIDGCRLSRARTVVYAHRSADDLAAKLTESGPFRRRFIVTDTVCSMDGDLAPLAALRELADRHDAALVVDEAHATGVLGPGGRGHAAALGVPVDVHIATLSKALGAFGAYVTGPAVLTRYLLHRARSYVFTTALPPSVVAAAAAAIDLVAGAEGERLRARLRENICRFGGSGEVPIFPIRTGDELRTMALTEALLARGVYAQGIRPPTVPPGSSRLRFALMATHTPEQIDAARAALHEVT